MRRIEGEAAVLACGNGVRMRVAEMGMHFKVREEKENRACLMAESQATFILNEQEKFPS